jgi:hypothetical protein
MYHGCECLAPFPIDHLLTAISPVYENSTLPLDDPLDGDCVRRNVYMYLCGASVDCRAMKNFATSATDRVTAGLSNLMPSVYRDAGLHRLYIPLRQGLELLRSQGNRPNMFPMRAAMAKLVDVTLLYFMENEGFKYSFEPHWGKEIYPMCFWDSVLFRRMGLIGEDDEEAVVIDESDQGTVVGETRRGEAEDDDDDDDVAPRAEKRQKDAEPRGVSRAQQRGGQQRGSDDTDPQMDTLSRHQSATEENSAKDEADKTESQTIERDTEPQPDVWCLSISKY